VLDGNLLPAWDAGWRPWHFLTLRRLILRAVNVLLRPHRHRSAAAAHAADGATPANEQFVSVTIEPPPPIAPRLQLAARMMLYRLYALVGRQKLGWGLRARLRRPSRTDTERPETRARD
jgi:hypothetical protein